MRKYLTNRMKEENVQRPTSNVQRRSQGSHFHGFLLLLGFLLLVAPGAEGQNTNVVNPPSRPVPVRVYPDPSASATPQVVTDSNIGAKTDSAATTDTGTFSLIALFKRSLQKLTTISTDIAALVNNTTGGATAANQGTANTSLSSIDGKTPALVSGRQPVDGSGVTQPVSAATLPLPTGAATSANQTTANTSLSSIDGKMPALVSGRQPVDGSGVTQPVSAATLPLPSGAATSANQSTANTSLSSIDGKTPALVSGRQPVDGSGVTQPISAATLPLPTGAAKAAGATNYANGQVTATTTAGTLKAANATRRSIMFKNLDTAITVYLGGATVTSANGVPLKPGESVTINATGLVQVISASGSPVVSYWEEYD